MTETNLISELVLRSTVNTSATTDDQHIDLSNPQELKKTLTSLLGHFEKPQKKSAQIIYDPLIGISQLCVEHNPQKQKQRGVLDKMKQMFSCACIQEKRNSLKMTSVLFSSLKIQQSKWLERHYNQYKKEELEQLKQEYVLRMKTALAKIRIQIQMDKVAHTTRQEALKFIKELDDIYGSIEPKKQKIYNIRLHKQRTYVFAMMISAFQVFSKKYNTYHRSILKKLFQQLQNQSENVKSSIEVLRFLEKKDPTITNLYPFEQTELDNQVNRHIADYLKKTDRITQKIHIGLVKISDSMQRRKVVNILVSGFLSEDKDKKQQWNQLLACMPDSEVYGLQWQSHTITQMIHFFVQTLKGVIIKGKHIKNLCTKDNPFISAFQTATYTGQILAYIVHMMFPDQFVNIVGFSLGAEVIRSFIEKSIELNGGINVNKVVTLGGASDVKKFQKTLEATNKTISILNCSSEHDYVLKEILKIAKPDLQPLGLNVLNQNVYNHHIRNADVSKKVKGHLAYRHSLGNVAEELLLNEQ